MKIFINSVQKEFATERKALAEYLAGDPLLRRFFEYFLFEDQPAADQRADQCYLDEVDRCDIYIGIFGNEYGWEDEREFYRHTVSSIGPPKRARTDWSMSRADDDGLRHRK